MSNWRRQAQELERRVAVRFTRFCASFVTWQSSRGVLRWPGSPLPLTPCPQLGRQDRDQADPRGPGLIPASEAGQVKMAPLHLGMDLKLWRRGGDSNPRYRF